MRTSHATTADAGRLFEDLGRALRAQIGNAGRLQDRGLLSVSIRTPDLALGPFPPDDLPGYYWSRASSGLSLIGTGVAGRIACAGPDRMDDLSRQLAALRDRWLRLGEAGAPPPIAFLGFAFDPDEVPGPEWQGLENTELVVPELQYRLAAGEGWLTASAAMAPDVTPEALESRWLDRLQALLGSRPAARSPVRRAARLKRVVDGDWTAPLDRALADIRDGIIDKVVLTRRVRYDTSRHLSWGRVLEALAAGHEDCALFGVSRPGFALLGVSPERLVSMHQRVVVADALAGTAPRGGTAALDRTLAERLRRDPKALDEHRIVVEQIHRMLAPCCRGLLAPQTPDIMSLPTVHHLWSPVGGHLKNGSDLLALAGRLHPTPAVGGSPRNAALDWLRRHENAGRGWYTGAFGWLDADGDGELSVVLRCGIINRGSVDLFAGAGIVAESRPDQELAETEWKLCTMRGALELG